MPAKPALKLKISSTPRNGGIESARCGTRMIGFSSLDILAPPRTMTLALQSSEAAYKAAGKKIEADALRYGIVLTNTDAVLCRIRQSLQSKAKEDA